MSKGVLIVMDEDSLSMEIVGLQRKLRCLFGPMNAERSVSDATECPSDY